MPANSRLIAISLAAVLCGLAVAGCSSKSNFEFDRLDVSPAEEELAEFPLGEYKIPISVIQDDDQAGVTRRNRFQFDFKLFAVVSPKEESQIKDAWERHEGVIRDQIIGICRMPRSTNSWSPSWPH